MHHHLTSSISSLTAIGLVALALFASSCEKEPSQKELDRREWHRKRAAEMERAGSKPAAAETRPIPDRPAAIQIRARELAQAFALNEVAANARFADKVLEVSGTVYSIESDSFSKLATIELKTGSDPDVKLTFSATDSSSLEKVRTAQQLSATCLSKGMRLGSIKLEDCKAAPLPRSSQPELVRIPPGEFVMGSRQFAPYVGDDESVHPVTITRAFLLGRTEVTQGQWSELMGSNPSRFATCGETCPVDQVSWKDAARYLNALSKKDGLPSCYGDEGTFQGPDCKGYRLPTEAEWEYAARAGTNDQWYGPIDEIAWYDANSDDTMHPVATRKPNAWGLYDMIGNVSEWVQDWYGDYQATATDPRGPDTGKSRVYRGGSNSGRAEFARVALRDDSDPGSALMDRGFRIARTESP